MSQRNAVYSGVVVKPQDPKRLGRVRVSLPSLGEEVWARRTTLAAGDGRGTWFTPDTGDEVLVSFENGNPKLPIVIGALWNASQRPPESKPERTVLKTKHGTTIVFDDGSGAVEIEDSNGNAVKLASSGVTVSCPAKVRVSASRIEIEAGIVDVDAGLARFTGVVQCEQLIADSVISATYTPGVGRLQ
jgi:phage baseplate assembly protein V